MLNYIKNSYIVVIVFIFVAAIYVAAATITVLEIAAAVQAGGTVHVSVYVKTNTQGNESIITRNTTAINNKETVLKIWTDNNGPVAASDFYSEIINRQIDYLVGLVKEQFPNADINSSSQILRNSLEAYYGLR